jgi:hypothetical protein
MLARALRVEQFLELAACLAAGAWLHARHGWSALAVALGILAWLGGSRLAMVALTSFLGWIHRSPRAASASASAARCGWSPANGVRSSRRTSSTFRGKRWCCAPIRNRLPRRVYR